MDKSISIVINARLSSTRLPNKMLLSFADTTLIDISLSKINELNYFKHRYLAVYDKELKDKLVNYKNVELIERDEDEVEKGIVNLKTRFKYFNKIDSDYIFLLNPCCPLISEKTISNAYNYFIENNFNSYTSVVESSDWIFDGRGNCITRSDVNNVATNKDNSFYKATHAFHILNKNFFLQKGYIWEFKNNDPIPILMEEEEYCDIDNRREFEIAEFLYKKQQSKKDLDIELRSIRSESTEEKFKFINDVGFHIDDDNVSYYIKRVKKDDYIIYMLIERAWYFQGENPSYHQVCTLTKEETRYLLENKGHKYWYDHDDCDIRLINEELGIK